MCKFPINLHAQSDLPPLLKEKITTDFYKQQGD